MAISDDELLKEATRFLLRCKKEMINALKSSEQSKDQSELESPAQKKLSQLQEQLHTDPKVQEICNHINKFGKRISGFSSVVLRTDQSVPDYLAIQPKPDADFYSVARAAIRVAHLSKMKVVSFFDDAPFYVTEKTKLETELYNTWILRHREVSKHLKEAYNNNKNWDKYAKSLTEQTQAETEVDSKIAEHQEKVQLKPGYTNQWSAISQRLFFTKNQHVQNYARRLACYLQILIRSNNGRLTKYILDQAEKKLNPNTISSLEPNEKAFVHKVLCLYWKHGKKLARLSGDKNQASRTISRSLRQQRARFGKEM